MVEVQLQEQLVNVAGVRGVEEGRQLLDQYPVGLLVLSLHIQERLGVVL